MMLDDGPAVGSLPFEFGNHNRDQASDGGCLRHGLAFQSNANAAFAGNLARGKKLDPRCIERRSHCCGGGVLNGLPSLEPLHRSNTELRSISELFRRPSQKRSCGPALLDCHSHTDTFSIKKMLCTSKTSDTKGIS